MKHARWRNAAVLCTALVGGSGLLVHAESSTQDAPGAQDAKGSVRVGVYDSRALAIAWARSDDFAALLREKRVTHDAAKAAGDTDTVLAIETEMKAMQHQIHLQGFGNAPVRDIVALMRGRLPAVAEKAGVDLIVSKWDLSYQREGVKLIDVTSAIVEPLKPDADTLKVIEEILARDPVPLEDLKAMDDH